LENIIENNTVWLRFDFCFGAIFTDIDVDRSMTDTWGEIDIGMPSEDL